MQIHMNEQEHAQLTAALEDRRDVLDRLRKQLLKASLNTHIVDIEIEVLDALKVSLGIEPADLFDGKDE